MTIASNKGPRTSSTREVPYLSIVRHSEALNRTYDSRLNKGSKSLAVWLSAAVLGGFACGFGAFLLVNVRHEAVSTSVFSSNQLLVESRSKQLVVQDGNRSESLGITQTVVPVTYDQAMVEKMPGKRQSTFLDTRSATVLEEVRTRNRRLEALVKVLRRRDVGDRREASVTHRN